METKKIYSIKNIICLLMILPMIFLFSACDLFGSKKEQLDIEASCDTSGTYAISNAAEYTEKSIGVTSFTNNAYRLTASIFGEMDEDISMKTIVKMSINAIISDTSIAYKISAEQTGEEKQNTTAFYNNSILYTTNEKGEKSSSSVSYESVMNHFLAFGYFCKMEQILSIVDNGENKAYEKNGNRFKITIAQVNIPNIGLEDIHDNIAYVYLNFTNNDKLDSLKMSASVSGLGSKPDGSLIPAKVKIKVTMSSFDGKIELPDPEEYM